MANINNSNFQYNNDFQIVLLLFLIEKETYWNEHCRADLKLCWVNISIEIGQAINRFHDWDHFNLNKKLAPDLES